MEDIDHRYYAAFFGDILEEFQKHGVTSSVGTILVGSSLLSIRKVIDEFYMAVKAMGNNNKTLVVVADFCFAGGMLNDIAQLYSVIRLRELDCAVCIQTSSASDTPSQGYFFTPLFYQLQRLSEEQLHELHTLCAQTDSVTMERMLAQCHQTPQLWGSNGSICAGSEGVIEVCGIRLFSGPKFFAFMAHAWLQHDCSLVPFHTWANNDNDVHAGKISMERFLFSDDKYGRKDFKDMLLDFSPRASKSYKVSIMGVKLLFDAEFNKPEAICGFRSPRWKHFGGEYFLLHIHFDEKDPFPGRPTFWKVINGVWDIARDSKGNNGTLIDEKRDARETTKTKDDGHFTLSDELVESIARYVEHHAQGAWSTKAKWNKACYGKNTIRNRNIILRESA